MKKSPKQNSQIILKAWFFKKAMSKFPKLRNIRAAILCQTKIQDIQNPLSDSAKSKDIPDEKIPGQERLVQGFPGVSSSILVIRAQGDLRVPLPSLVTG